MIIPVPVSSTGQALIQVEEPVLSEVEGKHRGGQPACASNRYSGQEREPERAAAALVPRIYRGDTPYVPIPNVFGMPYERSESASFYESGTSLLSVALASIPTRSRRNPAKNSRNRRYLKVPNQTKSNALPSVNKWDRQKKNQPQAELAEGIRFSETKMLTQNEKRTGRFEPFSVSTLTI
ncbi:MAG: hypothetical protein Q7R50_00600 [Dehalococcoidales bacterium]|nr:hypothetical protein [Dehalococcoidales bacterium]